MRMGALDDYLNKLGGNEKASTIAGPTGMRAAAQGKQQGALDAYVNKLGGSFENPQGAPVSMTGTYRSWYTGANLEGTKNGWDSDFQSAYQKGLDEAYERGDQFGYFRQPKATGVVTWDNAAGSQGEKLSWGDVIVDGKKVGNVYEDFDRHTANVMMGDLLIPTGERKRQLNERGSSVNGEPDDGLQKAWDDEVSALRTHANELAETSARRTEFNANVREEVETDDDRKKIVLGGALGTAGLAGATGGMVAGPWGALAGGVGGFITGGVGAWLNSDSLVYQLARSQEQLKIATAEGAGFQARLDMYSQQMMSIGMSPLGNLIQGTYDATRDGGVTGGTIGGEFYETNDEGQRKAGGVWQALDLAGMMGDSALQFASPQGRMAYQAQMTLQIGAGVVGMMPGQGRWDPTLLKQNSIWTSREYNPQTGEMEESFDLGNSLAGIGNVGIDMVQLGAISSLSRQTDRLAAQTAQRSGEPASRWAKDFTGNRFLERSNLSKEQKLALKNGAELETRSGYKFVIAEGGEIVGKAKPTVAMLAPSEGLNALSAKYLARRDAARKQGAVTAEQLYQTASDLALGQRGLTSVIVNAVGEGQEEVLQALLEPMSQDHAINGESVIRAGLAGAASGAGMTAGARLGRPTRDRQMFELGRAAWASQTNGEELTRSQWDSLDNLQKRTLVKSASALTKAVSDAAYEKIERDRIAGTVGGVVEAARLEDHLRDVAEAGLAKGVKATDQAAPIVMHESATFRPEALATSHTQLQMNQKDRTFGAVQQSGKLLAEIQRVETASQANPADTALAARLAELNNSHTELKEVAAASAHVEATIDLYVEAIEAAKELKDSATVERIVDGLNKQLESMYDMTSNSFDLAVDGKLKKVTLTDAEVLAYSKASSRLGTRDPFDSTSSMQVMMPQVNTLWSLRGADGIYGVSQIILKAIRGDYDGDKMRQLQQVVLDDKDFTDIRSGANILGAPVMPEIGSTKFEAQVAQEIMQAWVSRSSVLRDMAHKVGTDIEASLKARYGGVVPDSVLLEVAVEVNKALLTGADVRETVLTLMSKRAGSELTALGRGLNWKPGQPKLSNEYYWMANKITQHMQEFQSSFAEYKPRKGKPKSKHAKVKASETTTNVRRGRNKRGATDGSTALLELPGSNAFRVFQKMHYTMWETTEKFEGFATENDRSEYRDLVRYYERLSQGVLEQRLARQAQSPSDQIIGQVLTWLEESAADETELKRLGLSEGGDMALMANAAVGQMVWAEHPDGDTRLRFTGKEVSMAQHLLYLSLEKFKREHIQVWDQDTDLKAAYNNLFNLTKPQTSGDESSYPGNAEMAFVAVFNSTRLYDLIGTSAVSLGVQRTVGQVYRELVNLSVEERKSQKYKVRGGEYSDAEKGFTIPFGPKELSAGSVTAYKSVVDSLFSAADSSLSKNLTGQDKGKVHGRMADKSNRRGKAIQETWAEVRALLQKLEPRTSYTAADVSRIANEHQEFGHALMKTIPQSAMPWVVRRVDENGHVVFASWVYEVWTQPSAEEAEMHYLRNVILDSWYAKKRNLDIDFANGSSTVEKKISFDSLDSRFHQLMFRLSSNTILHEGVETQDQNLDLWGLKNFLTKLDEAKSVEKFMKWVNNEEGLVSEGAPMLAWMDDTAEFDPVRAGGGWSSELATPTMMEQINSLRDTAHRMIGNLETAAARSTADVNTAQSIQRWYRHLQNPDDVTLVASKTDRNNYRRFVALLEQSGKRRMTNGPRAMLQHTAHLVHGMYAPAHAKGANPLQMAANAALEAQDNAFGYLTQAERVLGDYTAHNEESVAQAPQMILRGGGRTMNRHGAQVEWEMNAVDAMLPLMLDPKKHSMMRAVLFDTVVELDTDNVARRKFLMGSTLDEVLTKNTVKDLFAEDKNPNLEQSMKFLVKLEQELRPTQKHMLEQKVTELVLARTTALDHTASFEEIQSMTVQAYMDMANVLQTVGKTRKRKKQEDPVFEAYRSLREVSMVKALAETYNIDPKTLNGSLANLRPLIEQIILKPYMDRIESIALQIASGDNTASRVAELRARAAAEKSVLAGMTKRVDRMFDLNITENIVAQYSYSKTDDPASKRARQDELITYVYDHGELMQAAGPALVTVSTIRNHFSETKKNRKLNPLVLTEKAWEELSNVIISVEIQRLLTVGPASKPPPPYPAALEPGVKGLDKRKYWDHSFSYLFDFLSEDDTTGIVKAARKLAVEAGHVTSEVGTEDVANKVAQVLLREGTLGTWTPTIPIQSIESYELLTGASANPSISMHGLLSRRWGAAMIATRRQYETDTVADSVVTLTGRDLDWMNNGHFHDVNVLNQANGRYVKRPLAMMNNRFAEDLSFTYVDTKHNRTTHIDLMNRPNVARTWVPATGTVPATRFKEVNISRLRDEIALMLQEMHPNVQPSTLKRMLDSVEVQMLFVNPDNQPASGQDANGNDLAALHANSVWHEGTVYSSDGDVGDSLIKAFFYGVGGLNPRGQQAALDTRKLGLFGIEDYQRPTFEEVKKLEDTWKGTDFARMLALKTKGLMDTPISNGKPVDVEFFNAAYKIMKLKHWVEGVDKATGLKVRWSAEQVIEWQQQNPDPNDVTRSLDFFGAQGPLENARLWIPSDQVLADMMGDIGLGGVRGRALKEIITDDLTTIDLYKSKWTPQMERKFSVDVGPTDLANTDVAKQAFVSDLRVSSYVTPQEKMRFQRRVEHMEYRMARALLDRRDASQRKTFDPVANGLKNQDLATDWVAAMDVRVNLPDELEYLTMERADLSVRTIMALEQYQAEQTGRAGDAGSSYWIFQEKGTSDAEHGRLTKGDLGGGLSLVPGEVVFLDTAAYQYMDPTAARELAMERIDYFVSQGVALMIGSSDGPNSLISELQTMTRREHGYQRFMNNNNILVPDVFDQSSFQNVAAARSRLVNPSAVNVSRQRLTMLLANREIEENTMWVPIRANGTRFDTIQAVFDLLPIDVNAAFNSPNTIDEAQKVQGWIDGLGDSGKAMLREEAMRHLHDPDDLTKLKKGVTQAELDQAITEFDADWDRLLQRLPDRVQNGTTAPLVGEQDFGTGDFIPLVNNDTGELMLYRHGYSYPKRSDYQRQLRNQVPGASGARGIVMYSGAREASATTHRGNVVGIIPSPGRGFRLELEIPVQQLGEKIVFEHNGMKYLLTDLPQATKVPALALFGDIEIDGYASLHDTISKEATDGLVVSFQNAFTVFGIDFREDVRKFFGTKNTSDAIEMLRKVARFSETMDVEEVYQLQSLLAGQDAYLSAIEAMMPTLADSGVEIESWASRIKDDTAEAAITRAILVYLMSPGADVDAILYSSGFYVNNPSLAGAESQRMPELFTRAFDLSKPDSAVRKELGKRINDKLNIGGGESWHLDTNSWELEGITATGTPIRGLLQYGEAHASEDSVLLNLMAQERKDSQSATYHQGLMNLIGAGGITRTKRKAFDRATGLRQQDLTDEEQAGTLWRDLTFVDPTTYGPGSRWQRRGPAENIVYARSIARMTQYRHAIDFSDPVFEKDRVKILEGIDTVVNRLGLRPSQEELVHYWIRQMLYHPAEGADQGAFSGDLRPGDVLGATRTILENIEDGFYPTYDAAGPAFFSYDDLAVLFQANSRGETTWAPFRKEGVRSSAAQTDNLGDWIAIAFGQAINERVSYDPIYRLDMSGFMNTYQTVLRNSGRFMDITLDKVLQGRLLDPETNELLTVTMDPTEHGQITKSVLMATASLEYDDLMRGAATSDDPNARAQAAAWRKRRLDARAKWRARHAVRPVRVQSSRDFVRNGLEVINKDADAHSLQRIVTALRHGTAMLNPGLYISMLPEQGFRMLLSEATNALTGQSTLKTVGAVQRGIDTLASRATGGRVNLEFAQYTSEQSVRLNRLFKEMGDDGAFTSLIISDMMWKRPNDPAGKVVRFFERYASLGNKWQDPTWGTRQKDMARHYVEAIIREIEAQPTKYAMSIDSVIDHLSTDPAYFDKEHKELHRYASNFVVDFRSLRNTPASLAMKRMYEPFASSDNRIVRFGGTLIKLQAMYATYNMNVLTTLTGMQGYSAMLAIFLDSKKKPGSWAKLLWKAKHDQEITDEDYRTFDMSTAIDGVNIANAFIKGGVTQTGLFVLGMTLGGILSGEDEEAKRRRRLAQEQGAQLIMDPRRLENDFRNKDMIFLDWWPPQLGGAYFRTTPGENGEPGRQVAQMSWLLKPFLSPILGMEKFFMTGDFGYITHGFMDAVSSMPLLNKGKWDDAARTADELVALAAEEQQVGSPTATKNAMYLLSSAVGVYENMLFENMFVNSVYAGLDTYDRDPTKLVLRDSDGVPQVDIEGNPRPNNVALQEFPEDNGTPDNPADDTIGSGYMKRGPYEANLAAYTENHFTAAAVMSLFTGFNKDLMRSEMVVRQPKIDLPELEEKEARVAIILATLNGQKAAGTLDRRLSLDEVTAALKGRYLAVKDWDNYNNLDANAMAFYKSADNPVMNAQSYIGPDDVEVLNKSGQAALFKGLMAGTITLESPEMRGIAITPEVRKEIERDFYQDMRREGMDLGLTSDQAKDRATRLMIGPIEDSTILGFRDILWSKEIPWTADLKYKQLNTTYVAGPDGFPWATGFKRGGAPGFGGFASLFGGLKASQVGTTDAIGTDIRMNSVDLVHGVNTGLRGLVPLNATELIPTDWEQTKQILDKLDDNGGGGFGGYVPNSSGGSGGGYGGNFYRGGYGGGYGGGGGGGRGYSPTIYWSKQPSLPRGTNVYGNFAKNLFWNNANIRRTTIRRERYQASRGRLNQWQ